MELSQYIKLLEKPLTSLISIIGSEFKQITHNRLLEYQTIEYKKNFFTKTLLHRTEPIEITKFYQPLEIILQKEENYIKKNYISTYNISTLFENTNYLTFIGKAGCGKSTLIKHLFINSVETSFKIPIKIELRYLNDYKKNIKEYIFEEIFLFHKIGISQEIIDRLLNSNSFVFFFDGYDEINSNKRENTTKNLDEFISLYPNNYYIITSRPFTNIDTFPLFSNFLVCDLKGKEIESFIKKQIPNSEKEITNKIINAVNKIDNNSYKQFLKNPLLLSMFILTYQSYSEIPQKRSYFYNQVFETLYSMHDSISKLSYVRDKISGLSKENFIEVLNLFSCITFFDQKFIFNLLYTENVLNLIKSKKKELIFKNNELIQDLQISIGILNNEGLDYTFPHRSLQEYFCVRYISNLDEKNKKTIYLKIKDLINKNWENYLISNHHFFLLLAEVDYNSMIKELILPLMEFELENIYDVNTSKENKYRSLVKLFICSEELLVNTIRQEKIHNDLSSEKYKQAIYFYGGTNGQLLNPTNELERYFTSKIEEIINLIISNGQIWVNSIRKNVTEIEKSDTDIISIL